MEHALRLIDNGFLDEHDTRTLAVNVGVTARHLNRLFEQHVGATPHRVAHARRLLFAKHLLDDSDLSITDIAFASGFGSLRRFNSAVRETWGRAPRELRKRKPVQDDRQAIRLTLSYRPPLDWLALLDFYRQRAIPGVETVVDDGYRRSIRIGQRPGWFDIRPAGTGHRLTLTAHLPDIRLLTTLVARIRRMFDLDADPMAVANVLGQDPWLAPIVATHPGLRIPGAWDPFEISVRAILGQQISVAAARTLATRIVTAFGEALEQPPADGPERLFPSPRALATAALEPLGIIATRADAIRRLAGEVDAGRINFESATLAEQLTTLPGIGDWTAQYVALRTGLDPDAFPAADLGLLRGAGNGTKMTPARLRKRADAWRPWRAYAALCLWQRI